MRTWRSDVTTAVVAITVFCHELHHAAGGMDTLLHYSGFARLAALGGSYENSPA